jgi:hypothetical protein
MGTKIRVFKDVKEFDYMKDVIYGEIKDIKFSPDGKVIVFIED